MKQQPSIDRARFASWASVIGAAALVLGGLIYLLTGDISIPVFACVVIGAAGIGLWMWWSPGEFQAWIAGRQTRYGTTSILISVLFAGLVSYAYVLVDRANVTADLTSVQRYSLNTPTLETIDLLRTRGFQVRIAGFFSHDKLREREYADLLLRQYAEKGGDTIEVQYIDPDEQPDLAERYGYKADFDGQLLLTVLDADGEPRTRDTLNAEGQYVSQYVTIYLGDASERNITTGLKTVASAGVFKIYFTTGHGERSLENVDDTGISRLFASLDGQGIAVAELVLAETDRIPDDASAVMIIGPWLDFTEAEVQVLDEYLQRGGRLGIFADPPIIEAAILGEAGNTFLQEGGPLSTYLWDEFGVRALDAFAIEAQPELINGDEWFPIINTIVPHTIMSDVRDSPITTRFVRPLEYTAEPDERQNQYVREPLLLTSVISYAESNITDFLENSRLEYNPPSTTGAPGDIPGPLVVALTVKKQLESQQEIQPRLILVGDSDILRNEFVKQVEIPGNVYFWSDTVDWLTGFAEVVTFTPISDPTRLNLVASAQERRTIAIITIMIVPGLILLAGTAVWWYRGRRVRIY
ncbi:MAG: Gldg family protein [Chloroflexi bacterium]|nr:Gldg family protein [Chloroflexota bacterium]